MSPVSASKDMRSKLKTLVAQRFDLTDQDADFCADWIESQLALESRFIDRPRVTAALEKVDRALLNLGVALKLSDAPEGTLDHLRVAILIGSSRGKDDDATIAYVDQTGAPDLRALERLADRFGAIRMAIAVKVDEISRDPYSKRTLSQVDGRAIGAVQGCRHVWKFCTGREPPVKDLNEASPFAKFLTDVMRECGMEDPKPVSAFRAWVRESQKSTGRAENSG